MAPIQSKQICVKREIYIYFHKITFLGHDKQKRIKLINLKIKLRSFILAL